MTAPTYRLPDWLGGHEVKVVARHEHGIAFPEVTVQFNADGATKHIRLIRLDLVEVRPPSIDDPVPLPLKIRAMAGGLNVDVVLCATYPDGAQLKIDDSDDAIYANLTPDGLRRLARAAWQRANAVERGQQTAATQARLTAAADEGRGAVTS